MASRHAYFRLPYLAWFARKADGALHPEMTEELRLLPEQLSAYQKQAQYFIERILDFDQVERDAQKNICANYFYDGPKDPALFRFEPISTALEAIDEDICGAVLQPHTIRDVIDFSLRDFVTRGTPVRRRKNCGRYFSLTDPFHCRTDSGPLPVSSACTGHTNNAKGQPLRAGLSHFRLQSYFLAIAFLTASTTLAARSP